MPRSLTEDELKSRFDRIVKSTDDAMAMLLKCHLLVEEQLDSFLQTIFTDSKAYSQARLSFSQKRQLVLSRIDFPSWYSPNDANEDADLVRLTFDYVASLNKIRNKLAHNVDYTDFESDLREELGLGQEITNSDLVREIREHTFYLYWYIKGYVEAEANQDDL